MLQAVEVSPEDAELVARTVRDSVASRVAGHDCRDAPYAHAAGGIADACNYPFGGVGEALEWTRAKTARPGDHLGFLKSLNRSGVAARPPVRLDPAYTPRGG